MANEDFYEAAMRHWVDGNILEREGEYDNAVCMLGFSAECALKKMAESMYCRRDIRRYSHFGEILFEDIKMMLSGDMGLAIMLDPACSLRFSTISLPEVLFLEHPERRYFGDGVYSEEDAKSCKAVVESLVKELAYMRLDGYI